MNSGLISYNYNASVQEPVVRDNRMVLLPLDLANNVVINRSVITCNRYKRLSVIMCRVQYDHNEGIQKYQYQYDFVADDGEVFLDMKSWIISKWMMDIRTSADFYKNPNNANAWDYVFDGDNPSIYQSEKLFVTSNHNMYVNTIYGWIKVDTDWFVNDEMSTSKDIRVEYDMVMGMRNLH